MKNSTLILTMLVAIQPHPAGGEDARKVEVRAVPALWRSALWGTAAQSCSAEPADEPRPRPEPALLVRYDIDGGRYVHFRVLERVDFVPESFTLQVRGHGDASLRIVVRARDAHGETFNVWPDGGITAGHDGWKTYRWQGGYRDSWGEQRDGKVDAPLTGVELYMAPAGDEPCRGRVAVGTLRLAGPGHAGPTVRNVVPLPVDMSGDLANQGAWPQFLHVRLRNRGDEPLAGRLEVADAPGGVRVQPDRVAVHMMQGHEQSVRLVLSGTPPNPFNRYRLRLRCVSGHRETGVDVHIAGPRSQGVNLGEFRDSTTIAASRFGVGTHFVQGYDWRRTIPLLRAIGVKWVRDGLRVHEVDGRWQVTEESLRYLTALREAGIDLCCIMYGPTEPAAYAAMMRDLVRQVGDAVKVWEIWNEPHNFTFRETYGGAWNGLDDAPWVRRFVELVAAASTAIRAEDPNAIIIAGDDVPPNNVQFMRLGMGAHVDGITHHPYNYGGQPPEATIWGSEEQVARDGGIVVADPDCTYRSLIDHTRRWAPGKQIWITEYGYTMPQTAHVNTDDMWKPLSEEAAARYLPRWYLLNFALGVDGIFQHTIQDGGDGPMGLLRPDFTPKPAYHAIGRVFGLLDATWELANDVQVDLGGDADLPACADSIHPDGAVGAMKVSVAGGIYHFAWRQPATGHVAVAYWHATWPEVLRPPLGRTLRIDAAGCRHPIRVDVRTGEHPDFPPTTIEPDGTMVWEDVAVPDYPVVVKLFKP